jgi:hypothetical protein
VNVRKTFASLCLVAICLNTLAPLEAVAGGWVTKEVKWQLSNVGAPYNPTGIYVRDTTHTVLAISQTDTTATFSLDNADPITRGAVGHLIPEVNGIPTAMYAYNSDTTIIGYLVMQVDTTAAPTTVFGTLTALIDGKVGGFGSTATLARGWVKADSIVLTTATGAQLITGDETVVVPLQTIGKYSNIREFGALRARISMTGTAALMSAVRVWVRYYDLDAQ